MEKITGVYAIHNMVNNNEYIGGSVDILRRWSIHRSYLRQGTHHSTLLQKEWDECYERNFILEVLEETLPERVDDREQYYIDTRHPIYNTATIAGLGGYFRDPEFQAKLPRGRDAREYLPEHGAAISAALMGRKLSAEHRRNIGKAQEGKTQSEASNKKRSQTLMGKPKPPRTQEHRDNYSQSIKNKWEDPEYRARMVEAAKNRKKKPPPRSQESRDQMSTSRKAAWEIQRHQGYTGMAQDEQGRFKKKH